MQTTRKNVITRVLGLSLTPCMYLYTNNKYQISGLLLNIRDRDHE